MKFGVREICDVVLRAKSAMKVGNKVFYKNEPVLYFDSLKTSSMEGQATTVYAQGGRGNARLIAWEGERTVTFTMEDALISPAGFSILTGAGLVQASNNNPVIIHKTETTKIKTKDDTAFTVELTDIPYFGEASGVNDKEDFVYVMLLDENGEIKSEPYIASESESDRASSKTIKVYATENDNSVILQVFQQEILYQQIIMLQKQAELLKLILPQINLEVISIQKLLLYSVPPMVQICQLNL